MRKMLYLGITGAALLLGAASAYALPPNSPYAIWTPHAVDRAMPPEGQIYGGPNVYGTARRESGERIKGQSTYVYPDTESGLRGDPWQDVSPENRTYYSRGR
jgi:hypothetical protein